MGPATVAVYQNEDPHATALPKCSMGTSVGKMD
jgi:hypothetical protein